MPRSVGKTKILNWRYFSDVVPTKRSGRSANAGPGTTNAHDTFLRVSTEIAASSRAGPRDCAHPVARVGWRMRLAILVLPLWLSGMQSEASAGSISLPTGSDRAAKDRGAGHRSFFASASNEGPQCIRGNMARQTNRLTDALARKIAAAGSYNDGGGLYLKVIKARTKSWVFRYKRGVKAEGKAAAYLLDLGAYLGARRMSFVLSCGRAPPKRSCRLTHLRKFPDAANRYIGARSPAYM